MYQKTGFIFLLHPRNIPHYQGQTLPQSKRIEKDISSQCNEEAKKCVDKQTSKQNWSDEEHLLKEKIQWEDIAILNIYEQNARTPEFIKRNPVNS